MTTARVWAPTRPTVDPDQVVLALLEAGDDPEKDLGAALLAVHRAGAAACQVVAAAPVPDEVALIRTLAQCRGRVAPAVAECVSKSVDDPQYAHLLTRDIFDDAEQAALTLFRACVAKGVSPPLACQRVGHVFGVPREDLGRYFALATNPATGVVALVDAADRALLAHVAKVARSETEDTKVTISKAPEPERAPRNPDFEATVRRDEDGRFAEEEAQPPDRLTRLRQMLGIAGTAPRVGGAPPIGPEPRPAGKLKRRTKTKRRVIAKPKEETERTPARQASRTPQRSVARSRVHVPRREIQARTEAEMRALRLPAPDPDRLVVTDVMKTRDDPNAGSYHSLSEPLAVAVPVGTGQYLRNQLVGQGVRGEPWILRIGHLLDVAGEMESADSPEAMHLRESAADQVWGTQDAEHEPIVHRIKRTEENWHDSEFVEHMRGELATDIIQTDQGPLRRVNLARKKNIVQFEDPDPDSSDILLVEFRPSVEGGPVQHVMVDEFVIGDGAVGRAEGHGRHTQYVLDPNQAYSLPDGKRPQRYFDEKSKAIVNRWWLTPISESDAQRINSAHRIRRGLDDVGKAAPEPERIRNPAFEATVNRDEEGQFAVEEEGGLPGLPRYAQRRKRRTKAKRRVITRTAAPQVDREATRQVTRQVGRQVGRQVSPDTRRQIQRGLVAHLNLDDPRTRLPELDDSRQYHVLSQNQMHELMRLADLPSMEGVRQLDTQSKAFLFGQDVHSGSAAVHVLREQVSEMVYDNEGGLLPRPLFRMKARNEDELADLGRAINAAFDKNPALAEITIEEVGRDDYQVYGNRHPVPDQYLIEYDDDVDFDAPLELQEIGHYRTKDMMLRGKDSWPMLTVSQSLSTPFNAPVQLYRLHNAGLRRFRAGRSD